ncbi:MAG: TonB-dependent receptor [Acidobacteriota bacterium]
MHRSLFSLLLCLLLLALIPRTLSAGTTGKIAGRITDEKSGEPIVGATIMIIGSAVGAASDIEGAYLIGNVSPGTYSLSISVVGYRKKIVQNVQVNVDFTTRIDAKMSSEEVNLDAVVVTAERPLIRTDLTSSQTSVDASQIRALPVESVTGLLTTQAGVVQGSDGALHFRGGRSDEIAFTVNGTSVNNPFTNTNSLSIATNAIQELSVVQGTFNAEYGNALSGVVETGLKEGGEKYTGQLSFYTGDMVSTHDNIFLNIKKIDPLSHTITEGTFGGPVPFAGPDLTFFLSARYEQDNGWLYGVKEYLPEDLPNFNTSDWKLQRSGDMSLTPMNTSKSLSATNRLTYKLSQTKKLNYDFIFNQARYRGYSHAFRYNPEGTYNNYENDVFHGLEFSDWIGMDVSYRIKGSYSRNIYEQYRYKDLVDEHYAPTQNLIRPVSTTFYFGGSQNGRFERMAETFSGKFDMTAQLSKRQEVKLGVEGKFPQMFQLSYTVLKDTTKYRVATMPLLTDPNYESYARFPKQYSAYIQDKMEYESIVMNLGLRYDYFKANAEHFLDPYDPQGARAFAKAKQTWSPRIGISYPITDKGIIHFSYGHFFQMPQLRRLYENPEFRYQATISATTFGNADLNPQKTITYEIGLQQQLTDNMAFNVTGFYKDVRDLFAVQTIRISGEKEYSMYVNKDYANIKGFTFSLTKRRTATDMLAFTLDYTYQVAEGNDVNSDAFFIDKSSGRESEKVVVPLGWDQTHTLNATVGLGKPNDWNVSIIGRLGTGLPYTPLSGDNGVILETYSGSKPTQYTVDMLAQKELSFAGVNFIVFLKVFNLFDRLNEVNVFEDTGRATYTLANSARGEGKAIDQHMGLAGVHPMSEYYANPGLYSDPREVLIGCSVNF